MLATIISLGMQLNNNTREIITPVLSFILKDYAVEEKLALMWENSSLKQNKSVIPVMTDPFITPCEKYQIDKNYGWYWNQNTKKQEFSPGIQLAMEDNSLIKAVREGVVIEVKNKKNGRTVIIKHTSNLFSYYEGLKEVFIGVNDKVKQGDILGKSSDYFYFELRSEDGPLNPISIFD